MAYDDIIRATGEFGRHQRKIQLLLCISLLPVSFHVMGGVFLQANTDFRCLLPYESPENATYLLSPNLTNSSYHWYETENSPQCERYDVNLTDHFYNSVRNISLTTTTVKCDSFVYDKSTYELTTTTEFNLICDKAWLRATADSLFMVGVMVGSSIFGGLSDRYGRKPVFFSCLFIQTISGLLIAISPEIISFMIFRFIVGTAGSGIYLTSYVTVIEMVVPERRLFIGIVTQLSATLGYILTSGFAYFISNWRILQAALSIPNLVFFIYWWFIPESGRWLVCTGRLEKAKVLLEKISVENNAELPQNTLDNMLKNCSPSKSDSSEEATFLDLLRQPNLRRKTLLLFFSWLMNVSTYFGISWNTSNLAGNEYLNFAIAGLVEIPAIIFLYFTLDRWGRRNILSATMLLSGTSLLLIILVPDDISWLPVVLTMIGKLAITASYATIAIFTAEQYPTVIRNIGMGACNTCGTVGGILSSYVNYSAVIWKHLPVAIFGSGVLIAGLSSLLLPETSNEKLPESLEDGEQFGKSTKLDKTLSN